MRRCIVVVALGAVTASCAGQNDSAAAAPGPGEARTAAVPVQASVEDRYFDSNGLQIRYVDLGRGEPVVLVHSASDSVDLWRERGILDALTGDFRVIALDLRGHGRSGKPHDVSDYGMKLVNDIERLLDRLEIPRAHLVGYSLGGYVVGRPAGCVTARRPAHAPADRRRQACSPTGAGTRDRRR